MDSTRSGAARPVRIGVIASRHDMPVDEYLVESVTPGQSAYDQIYAAVSAWLDAHPEIGRRPDRPLELYYSGLTEATLAVADAVHNFGLSHAYLMRYDRDLADYEPLRRKLVSCSQLG